MRIADRIGTLLIIALLGFIVWEIVKAQKKDPAKEMIEYWENKDFKTDTVHVEVDYDKLPKPVFKYTVPPAVIHKYPVPNDNGREIVLKDSLVKIIDSLQNEIASIHERFFTVFPESPKLLYGEFSKDTVELEFLNTDGFLHGAQYGVNYDKYKYQWVDNKFKAVLIPQLEQSKPRKIDFSLYGYIGYDLFLQSPLLKAEYNVDFKRIRLQGGGYLPVQNTGATGVSLNLGYKIK